MLGSCRLNNKSMRNVRRTDAYQAIAIDLALLGIISKEECEMLLDGGIPSGIVLPDGSSKLTSENNLPPKPDFIQTEPVDTEPVVTGDTETGDTETGDTEPVVTGDTETSDTETGDKEPVVTGDTEPVLGVIVSDGATTDEQPSVDPVMPGDETQEPVDDEGRTEPNN